MRKPLIAGNWKMNTNIDEAKILVQEMITGLDDIRNVDKVLCPPFISLSIVRDLIVNTSIQLGAQNMHFQHKGAYTGEISPLMLTDLCEFVILGHSERRQYFSESDDIINKKMLSALDLKLIPILCVGESLEENESNRTEDIITRQVQKGLAGIAPSDNLVLAYEPIWAIGTGRAATSKQASTTILMIRNIILKLWGKIASDSIRILYGGSVTAANINEIIAEPEIDGALVGGASLKAEDFIIIVRQTATIKSTG